MQKKEEWLDFIKVFAVLATLFLHSNSTLVNFQTSIVAYPVELNMYHWNIGVVFASLAGPSFALIFMYLGTVVLSSPHTSISFFLGKVKNLLAALVFWTLFSLLFQKYIMHWEIDLADSLALSPFIAVATNLWILYLLIGAFLIVPILKIFVDHSSTRQQIYLVILWLYAVITPPLIEKYFHIDISFYMPMMIGYVGFMLIGFILSKIIITKKLLWLAILFFIVGNLWTIVGSIYYNTPENILKGVYVTYLFNRFSIPVILNSIGSFILLRLVAEKAMQKTDIKKTIAVLSSTALGLCMVYPYWFIILGTEKIGIELTAFSGNPLWSVPLTALATILGSFFTVSIIKKIPYLRKITPKLY